MDEKKMTDAEFIRLLSQQWADEVYIDLRSRWIYEQLHSIADRVERLERALTPFAELCPGELEGVGGGTIVAPSITVQMIKDARDALSD